MTRHAEGGAVALELALFLPLLLTLILVEVSFGLVLYRTAITLERVNLVSRSLARGPWNDLGSEPLAQCLVATGENEDSGSCPVQAMLPGLELGAVQISFKPTFGDGLGGASVPAVTVSVALPLDDLTFGLTGFSAPTLTMTYPWVGP